MLSGGPHPTSELLGHWRGESICVKADWNAACNDEVVFYDVVPGEKPDRVLLRAYKIVNGRNEPMGDLEFAYESFQVPGDAEQTLCVYQVEPGSPTADGLRLLASWIAPQPAAD